MPAKRSPKKLSPSDSLLQQGCEAFRSGRPIDAIPLLSGYVRMVGKESASAKAVSMLGRAYAERARQRLRNRPEESRADIARAEELGVSADEVDELRRQAALASGSLTELAAVSGDDDPRLRRGRCLEILANEGTSAAEKDDALTKLRALGMEISESLGQFLLGGDFDGEPVTPEETLAAVATELSHRRRPRAAKLLERLNEGLPAELVRARGALRRIEAARDLSRHRMMELRPTIVESQEGPESFLRERIERVRRIWVQKPEKAAEAIESISELARLGLRFRSEDELKAIRQARTLLLSLAGLQALEKGGEDRAFDLWSRIGIARELPRWVLHNFTVHRMRYPPSDPMLCLPLFEKLIARISVKEEPLYKLAVERQLIEMCVHYDWGFEAESCLSEMIDRGVKIESFGDWMLDLALRSQWFEHSRRIAQKLTKRFGTSPLRVVGANLPYLVEDCLGRIDELEQPAVLEIAFDIPGDHPSWDQVVMELKAGLETMPADDRMRRHVRNILGALLERLPKSSREAKGLRTILGEVPLSCPKQLLHEAEEQLKKGQLLRAQALFDKYIAAEPDDASRVIQAASKCLKAGRRKLGERYVTQFAAIPGVEIDDLAYVAAMAGVYGLRRHAKQLFKRIDAAPPIDFLAAVFEMGTYAPSAVEIFLNRVPLERRGASIYRTALVVERLITGQKLSEEEARGLQEIEDDLVDRSFHRQLRDDLLAARELDEEKLCDVLGDLAELCLDVGSEGELSEEIG
ncbi:MAG: hypothetical protein RL885_06820 [Planctomycetota bacterium]